MGASARLRPGTPGPPRAPGPPAADTASPWAGPPIRFDAIPLDLPGLTEWFERMSYGLVLREPYPLPDVRRAINAYEKATDRHVREAPTFLRSRELGAERTRLAELVRADHLRFRTSFEQLRWFYAIVAQEDHGGHRQALGQYGRLLTESMRRHLADELIVLGWDERPAAKR